MSRIIDDRIKADVSVKDNSTKIIEKIFRSYLEYSWKTARWLTGYKDRLFEQSMYKDWSTRWLYCCQYQSYRTTFMKVRYPVIQWLAKRSKQPIVHNQSFPFSWHLIVVVCLLLLLIAIPFLSISLTIRSTVIEL